MEALELHQSYLSWIFPAFLLIFGLVAFLRIFYPKHFADYQNLLFNNKYIVIYGKKERRLHLFMTVLFLLQCVCLALLFYVMLKNFGITELYNSQFMFLELVLVVFSLLITKLLLQQWISSLFDLYDFARDYIFTRVSYSSYAAIVMVILLFLGVYIPFTNKKQLFLLLFVLVSILLAINVLGWIKIIKNNQKEIKPYLFYFILYLCTLEIAPYIFLIYGTKYLIEVQKMQKIDLTNFTAVILTSRKSVDHYFRIAEEMRFKVPTTMKYFCQSEAIAYYLQKYITYRKRKIYVGKKEFADLLPILKKYKEEKFLFPGSDAPKPEATAALNDIKIKWERVVFYRTEYCDISAIKENKYDILTFFSPAGIEALFKSFPDFSQKKTKIAVYGDATLKAAEEAGLIIDIKAPSPESPSMTVALDHYLGKQNSKK